MTMIINIGFFVPYIGILIGREDGRVPLINSKCRFSKKELSQATESNSFDKVDWDFLTEIALLCKSNLFFIPSNFLAPHWRKKSQCDRLILLFFHCFFAIDQVIEFVLLAGVGVRCYSNESPTKLNVNIVFNITVQIN